MFKYFSLVLLVTTGYLYSNEVADPLTQIENFQKEMTNLFKDYKSVVYGETLPSISSRTSTYSTEEYGLTAPFLNKLKQLLEFSKQEATAAAQAFKDVGLDNLSLTDVCFDLLKIVDTKKKLERYSTFLDEMAKREDNARSEFKEWLLTSPDLDELVRKPLLDGHYEYSEKTKSINEELYKIKNNIICEYIKLLDFLSKIYGTYKKGKNPQILFSNERDLSIYNSYAVALTSLSEKEKKQTLLFQQNFQQNFIDMENDFVTYSELFSQETKGKEYKEYIQGQSLVKRIDKFLEFCSSETAFVNQAYAEVDINKICTYEVFFDLVKMSEKKKKLEQMCIIFDESEKKWIKNLSDISEQVLPSPFIDDLTRKKLETFHKGIPNLIKQSFCAKKICMRELIKLLDFFSMRYGTYKRTNNNQNFSFSYDFERDLYELYMKNIEKFLQEDQNIDVLISDLQSLFK